MSRGAGGGETQTGASSGIPSRQDQPTPGFRQTMERSRLREMAIRLPRLSLALECALSRHWNSHLDLGNAKP